MWTATTLTMALRGQVNAQMPRGPPQRTSNSTALHIAVALKHYTLQQGIWRMPLLVFNPHAECRITTLDP
jgi:hypothetical protein